jgi:O-antigen/teichoic acid export membrane protein
VGSGIFFGLMAFASAISLVRGFAVAGVIDPAAFGVYVTVVAAATFASNLLSLGRVEATMKDYPRLFASGSAQHVRERADALMRTLTLRALAVLLPAGPAAWLFGGGELLLQVGLGVGVALGVALSSLYASAHRATLDLTRLGSAAFVRAALALAFGTLGALLASWPGALTGEIVAAVTGVLISRQLFITSLTRAPSTTTQGPARASSAVEGGRWLFAATLLAAAPIYLDRAFVKATFGATAAGSYGFVMLFLTGATTAVGIISQKLGPQLVREEHAGAPLGTHLRLTATWAGAFALVCVAGMAVMGWALLEGPLHAFGARYQLSWSLLALVCLLCCAQVSVMFDWIFISRDHEKKVFAGATAFVAATACAAVLTLVVPLDLQGFVSVMVLAKLVHLVLQGSFLGLSLLADRGRARAS